MKQALFNLTTAVTLMAGCTVQAQTLLPSTQLTLGPYTVTAEIAADDSSRAHGLMFRETLPTDRGMLFVFDTPDTVCFWMKNTPLPLSIAFIDSQGIILNIDDMQPQTTTSHCPVAPTKYALEMNQGWFTDKGIGAGTHVKNLPR
jgi:hypothetical protein